MTRDDFESFFTTLLLVLLFGGVVYRDGIIGGFVFAGLVAAVLITMGIIKSALWWLLSKLGKAKP